MIRPVTLADAAAIAVIYNHYVLTTTITFEEDAVSAATIAERIVEVTATLPWFVYEERGEILGYTYAGKWKGRCAYRYTVETSIYLRHGVAQRGLGSKLYTALIDELRVRKQHSLIGGIALPNPASIALHEKFGFEKIGQFKQVGWKFEQWIDVGYWELILR